MNHDILVAEDDEDFRHALCDLLRLEGFTVRAAADGVEAISLMRGDRSPAVVVLDLMMPGMNGYELRSHLSRTPGWRDIPVVVLSAVAEPGLQRALGVSAVLTKPVDIDSLVSVLRALTVHDA